MDDDKPLFAPERPPVPSQPRDFALSPPWHMGQSTLKDFQRLPRELQDRIWDLAVYLRNTRPRGRADYSPLGIDMPTALSVALVSRECYRRITPRIYRRIQIEKPSALRELQATLSARPHLGTLIEALHVGPAEQLAVRDRFIRIVVDRKSKQRVTYFSTSLMNHPLRPDWCCPTHEFKVPGLGEKGRWRVISDAIEAAYRALDVDISRRNYDNAGRDIGNDAWCVRYHEAQAALNLFLIEMGRREKENGDQCGERTSYPRLFVTDEAISIKPGEDVLRLSRSQLRDHIARPGAPTDHFHDELLFARSGINSSQDQHDIAERFSVQPRRSQQLAKLALDDAWDPLPVALPSTATIGGIFGLVRSVLSFAPNVRSFSLKSYLEHAVCGKRGPPQLPALTSLTIGPSSRGWKGSPRLDQIAISSLERLRLAGHPLGEYELVCIAGDNGALPKLRSVQYSSGAKYSGGDGLNIVDVVRRLCGIEAAVEPVARTSHADAQGRKRARESEAEDEGLQPTLPTRRSHPLYIELRLVPEDAKAVLDSAPTSKMREAWRTGKPMPGSATGDRLQVFVSRGYEDTRFAQWASMQASWELQSEAEEWWDEGLRAVSRSEEEAVGVESTAAA